MARAGQAPPICMALVAGLALRFERSSFEEAAMVMIRAAVAADAPRICEIYNHYVQTTVITFEEKAVTPPEMTQRIADVTATFPWLVYEAGGTILGYAYAAAWHKRSAYRYSVESTIYLAPDATRQGVGRQLYGMLIRELRAAGLHCMLGGIALPNEPSVALHEKLGFTKIGHIKEVGWKLDRWVDVGYWQLVL